MGTGKTTVGRIVAERLGRPFVDSDEQVEARTGRTVREIFEADGEPTFRAEESAALAEALAAGEPTVVAAAGGVVLDPENRRRLREAGVVVWLRAAPDVLAGRVDGGSHRPLLADDPAGVLTRLADERAPLYKDVADAVVDVDGLTPAEVADRVLELAP